MGTALLSRLAVAAPADQWWVGLLSETGPLAGLTVGGIVTIVFFAMVNNKLLGIKQHESIVANLKEGHAELIREKDNTISRLEADVRDALKSAEAERRIADETQSLLNKELTPIMGTALKLLQGLPRPEEDHTQ